MTAHTRSLIALAVVCFVQCLHAQEAPTNAGRPSPTLIKTWIAELANRDPKPFTEPYVLKPPRNVNRESLEIVKNAYDKLSANAPEALPDAVEWALKQPKPEPRELVADEDWNKYTKELKRFYDTFNKAAKPLTVQNELWFEGK